MPFGVAEGIGLGLAALFGSIGAGAQWSGLSDQERERKKRMQLMEQQMAQGARGQLYIEPPTQRQSFSDYPVNPQISAPRQATSQVQSDYALPEQPRYTPPPPIGGYNPRQAYAKQKSWLA